MKILTLGWLSVIFAILLMNVYIFYSYWKIPFAKMRLLKLGAYVFPHIILTVLTVYYFTLFFSEKTNTQLSNYLSYIASFYMGTLSYSFFMFVIHDLISMTNRIINYPSGLKLLVQKFFFGGILIYLLAASIAVFGIINDQNIRVKNYQVKIEAKENKGSSLKLVYISDLHVGTSLNILNIDEILRTIQDLNPDLFIIGGDVFDEGTPSNIKTEIAKKLASVETPFGTFFVEGNHEYKSGNENIEEQVSYFKHEGIYVLQDEIIEFDDFILIGRKDASGNREKLAEIIGKHNLDKASILIDHRPSFKETKKIDGIDLQISGHSHSGQFFPMQVFNPMVSKFLNQYVYGHHKIKEMDMIVSSGIGSWGIPIRIGSQREIVRIEVDL